MWLFIVFAGGVVSLYLIAGSLLGTLCAWVATYRRLGHRAEGLPA